MCIYTKFTRTDVYTLGCLVSTSVFKGNTENNPLMNGLLQSSMILNIIVEVTNHEIRYLLHY